MMAQKMEHKNIPRKVKCSALTAEDVEEAAKRAGELTEGARADVGCFAPHTPSILLLFKGRQVTQQLILNGNYTAERQG